MEFSQIELHAQRILLIEDDLVVQKVHKTYLLKMGYEVDVAANGKQALTIYSNEYDAIILDANLPDIDGFSIAKSIRQQEAKNHSALKPLILLSAYPQDQLVPDCEDAGINAFATKPIVYEKLQAMLLQQLPRVQSNRASSLNINKEHYQP